MTSGELPLALCCRRGAGPDPGPEHPWATKKERKSAKLASFDIFEKLEACGNHRGWSRLGIGAQSSHNGGFRIRLNAAGCESLRLFQISSSEYSLDSIDIGAS